ncbi:MAG: C-terminal binding protein [Deltaproteobacteria bacterium]|nr:C-terminal binding protein [Deltaproteobacteria bacterium]
MSTEKRFKAVTLCMSRKAFDLEKEVLAGIGAELIPFDLKPGADFRPVIRDADALLVEGVDTLITEEVINGLTKCKIIVRYAIGVENIDLRAAERRNIVVCNVPDYCIGEVSSHALTLLLASVRKIVQTDRLVREGTWNIRSLAPFPRLSEQTLGILGYGRIGRAVSERAHAFGFRILANDPYIPEESVDKSKVTLVDLDTLLRESDYLTLHLHLTRETRNMIGPEQLRKMKKNALLINTARGEIVDEKALIRALDEKWIAGAALDVLSKEPPDRDNPLLRMDNVLVTPHAAWFTEGAYYELHRKAAEEAARVLLGEKAHFPMMLEQ